MQKRLQINVFYTVSGKGGGEKDKSLGINCCTYSIPIVTYLVFLVQKGNKKAN